MLNLTGARPFYTNSSCGVSFTSCEPIGLLRSCRQMEFSDQSGDNSHSPPWYKGLQSLYCGERQLTLRESSGLWSADTRVY